MAIAIIDLPYDLDALEPHISKTTMEFHHRKHYTGYVNNVNKMINGSDLETADLETIVKKSHADGNTGLFNNAAQAWNHAFFWQCLRPGGGGEPAGDLKARLDSTFGSFEKFKEEWKKAGAGLFGSGWVWLVLDGDAIKIVQGKNADTPLITGGMALLTMDVWEHAYYLDYQNRRPDFIDTFLNSLVNWEFAGAGLL